jgi:hypothetical protein
MEVMVVFRQHGYDVHHDEDVLFSLILYPEKLFFVGFCNEAIEI